ncbi:MAG: hypothetical protein Q9196_007088, partial [Gyalolechia fulgens]
PLPKLWFGFDNHFLYTDDETSECFVEGSYNDDFDSVHSGRYKWLFDLKRHATDNQSNLSLIRVMIEERIKHPRGFKYGRHVWQLPSSLQKACNGRDFNVEVWLRKPK